MRSPLSHFAVILCYSTTTTVSALSTSVLLFQNARPELLNLLNHPLQLQLATGDLQLGAFQRLLLDRKAILEGLEAATQGMPRLQEELALYESEAEQWLTTTQEAGKTISVPGIECYSCGGDHLNLDCPEDQEISSSAQALKSLLLSNGLEGATAVLQGYSFACSTLLKACEMEALQLDPVYHGWLSTHADRWSQVGDICGEKLSDNPNSDGYTVCLSMLYNWIDGEAATTGIRADLNDATLSTLMDELERLEPGYAAQRDKHQSFVADLTGVKSAEVQQEKAQSKVSKAAAYLAAKNKNNKNDKLDAAVAYLATKKKKEIGQ